ncbi:uncharacterized protein LOC119392655 [Rhipicephalus sanguineus]|uniref:uncharacterized protein LOC119392655 n=1 Tax=Rhipicephalus sanguineus TaxID=34632 RepID=UPI001894FE8F|nr:uncharacterized protein LOC119392655 [Rhipicephalus sanguineus]
MEYTAPQNATSTDAVLAADNAMQHGNNGDDLTMGSDSNGVSSVCSRTLTSPQPAILGDRSEQVKDLHQIDDGGDYSGDCAATVCDPCDVNHFIIDDDNTTDFDSCDDTTDLTTMGTQHDTMDSVTQGVFPCECNSAVGDVADGKDNEEPLNGNLSTCQLMPTQAEHSLEISLRRP